MLFSWNEDQKDRRHTKEPQRILSGAAPRLTPSKGRSAGNVTELSEHGSLDF